MTTARSSTGNPGPARGRGLDALFEGAAAGPAIPARNVDADLAALLDNEVSAAETGASPGARLLRQNGPFFRRPVQPRRRARAGSSRR